MSTMPRPAAAAAAPILDSLTGIPSDQLFWHLLSNAVLRAERQAHNLALLAIYVRGLSELNAAHGRDAGDAALRVVAARLAGRLRRSDSIARLAGTKFAVLAEALTEDADVQLLAEALIETLAEPIPTVDGDIRLAVSIGIALYPRTADKPSALLAAAITAMDDAVAAGENTYRLA
ncbi:MAG TPA: GGDEF domain-containing protein [Alphaproteobacteria bacterium]|jgi:diguanylate cyclase (GGDEF)-like protein